MAYHSMEMQKLSESGSNSAEVAAAIGAVQQSGELYYDVAWRSHSIQPGSHKTKLVGSGSDFAAFVPLLDCPDPKRIDIRASFRTLPKRLMVRTFYERSQINVVAVNDVSASMLFKGKHDKQAIHQTILHTIAWSAARQGDAFGMVCCDDVVHQSTAIRPAFRRTMAQEASNVLMNHYQQSYATDSAATALPAALKQITKKKSLVFLISDFYLPEAVIKDTFRAYSQHDVVPIVLWDDYEYIELPEWGWYKLREMETGRQRSVFMRPKFQEKLREAVQNRKRQLIQLSQTYGMRAPFFVHDTFKPSALSQHLLGSAR